MRQRRRTPGFAVAWSVAEVPATDVAASVVSSGPPAWNVPPKIRTVALALEST